MCSGFLPQLEGVLVGLVGIRAGKSASVKIGPLGVLNVSRSLITILPNIFCPSLLTPPIIVNSASPKCIPSVFNQILIICIEKKRSKVLALLNFDVNDCLHDTLVPLDSRYGSPGPPKN